MPHRVDAVLLNGTVGTGKSTTAAEVSRIEGGTGVVHALIDVDAVRGLVPSPPGDPFQRALAWANLRDLARNHRAAGAVRLVLAGVLESREDRWSVERALSVQRLLVVRLTLGEELNAVRLRGRHEPGAELEWHLRRAPAPAAVLDRAGVDDLVLDASERTPAALAHLVRSAAGWS